MTRRVVAGHSADSKAVFVSDSIVEPHHASGLGFEFFRLWGAESAPSFPDAGSLPAYQNYFPPVGGFRFDIFTIPAERTTPPAKQEQKIAYARMGEMLPDLPAHMESTNPGMHTTDSIDFGYVISGNIWLELDDGSMKELHAGDTYVQNGTRHAWRNRSSEPCSILIVLIGTKREPSGLSVAQRCR